MSFRIERRDQRHGRPTLRFGRGPACSERERPLLPVLLVLAGLTGWLLAVAGVIR
jgi:hypothetical protein